MPTLHLIDAVSPQACATTLAWLADARNTTGGDRVWLLGGPALERTAVATGLAGAERISVPFGHAMAGVVSVMQRARSLDSISQVQAWSVTCLALARVLLPHVPNRLMLTQMPDADGVRWLRWLTRPPIATGELHITTVGHALAEAVKATGLPNLAVESIACRICPERLASDAIARQALRERWGAAADQTTKVVALLGDPPPAADARVAAMAMSLAQASMPEEQRPTELVLLVHPKQRHRLRTRQMLEALRDTVRLVQEPGVAAPWQILAGVDVILMPGDATSFGGPGGLSLAWALASGRPVVAVPCPAVREQITPGARVRLADGPEPQALAHELTGLLRETAARFLTPSG